MRIPKQSRFLISGHSGPSYGNNRVVKIILDLYFDLFSKNVNFGPISGKKASVVLLKKSVNIDHFVNTRLFPGASKMSLDLIVCVAALSLRYGIASPDLKICPKKRKANEILTGGVSASTRYYHLAQNVDSHRDNCLVG